MNGVNQVIEKIRNIENRFGPHAKAANHSLNFASLFEAAQKSSPKTTAISGDSTMNSDIASIVHSAALKYGVNPMLALAVAKTESNLAPDAVSPAGAAGVMQLMPETASELGIQNIADPRENIDGGVRYLKQMLNIFNGDVNKAVAAYNAGPQAVKQYGGIPPYRETQEYVARVSMLAK